MHETTFIVARTTVKPLPPSPLEGKTRFSHTCLSPIHSKTKMSVGLSIDIPSNGLVKKFVGASNLTNIQACLNMLKRTSLTKFYRYLNPNSSLQHTAERLPPKESKHALRQPGKIHPKFFFMLYDMKLVERNRPMVDLRGQPPTLKKYLVYYTC